jgi:ATP-binding cassette, subfamily B, bacterial
VEIVKSLGLEDQEIKRLNDVNAKILGLDMQKIKTVRALSFLQGTIINALRAGLLFLMLWLIYTGDMTVGELFSLFVYSFFIFTPLAEFATVAAQYQEARASLELVAEVLNKEPEEKPTSPKSIAELEEVQFDGVGFSYASSEEETVRSISFAINGGETVAFVGPSGSGKSTIIKLLVGLYKPQSGQIRFNGLSAGEIDYGLLRRRLGFVSQETQLFAGTIRDNLLFVRPDATDDECLAALKQAAALPIVERGDKGLDTKIGEGGIKVSGGERQRLAIARALLREPSLIIFDEATSSLDSITERAITSTIRESAGSRPELMTVLVAHRLSTVIHADRIYVMERGKIVESGSHSELAASGGLYAALWREQSGQEP